MQNSQRVLLAKPSGEGLSEGGREPGGPAAKHRALPQRDTSGAHGDGTRAVRTATGHG